MTPTKQEIQRLQDSLQHLDDRGGLDVLAMVAGISEDRLRLIIDGAHPDAFEYMTLDTLRGM